MVNEWAAYCLTRMDLPRWIKRAPSPALFWIVLPTGKPPSQEEQKLLNGILLAMGVACSQVRFVEQQGQIPSGSRGWVLGGEACSATSERLNTPDLMTLLARPLLKKQVFLEMGQW